MCEDCIVYERCTSSEFSEDPGSSEMSEDCIFSKIVNPQNFLWIDFFLLNIVYPQSFLRILRISEDLHFVF